MKGCYSMNLRGRSWYKSFLRWGLIPVLLGAAFGAATGLGPPDAPRSRRDGQPVHTLTDAAAFLALAWHPAGEQLAVACNDVICLWRGALD
jgi:hypothetical protein